MKVLHLGRPEWTEGMVLSTDQWPCSAYWHARRVGTFQKVLPTDLGEALAKEIFPDPVRLTVIAPLLQMVAKTAPIAEILKEYVFEDARQRAFDAKPSRWRALFALPEECNEVEAAEILRRMSLLGARRPLVELELLDGRVHRGASALLNCNSGAPVEIEAMATRYWTGEGQIDEVLYEGAFRIGRIVGSAI